MRMRQWYKRKKEVHGGQHEETVWNLLLDKGGVFIRGQVTDSSQMWLRVGDKQRDDTLHTLQQPCRPCRPNQHKTHSLRVSQSTDTNRSQRVTNLGGARNEAIHMTQLVAPSPKVGSDKEKATYQVG